MRSRFLISAVLMNALATQVSADTMGGLLSNQRGLLLAASSYAGVPVWTFLPLTDTTLTIPANGTATIQYQVTNQSKKTHTLAMTSIPGITQLTTPGNCLNPFTLGYQQSCTLTLEVSGAALQGNVIGGPEVCQQGNKLQCYQSSSANSLNVTLGQAPGETMISASVSDLALSVTGLGASSGFSGTSGMARKITISNTGSAPTTNLMITYPTWPTDTTASSTCTSTLAAGGTCEITVTPGNAATNNASAASCASTTLGSEPVPGVIEVRADNASPVSTNVVVLGYGCIYQGGYLFSIAETADVYQSIGGKVVFTADQGDPSVFVWRSSGSGAQGASSITDGASNTNILANAAGTYPAAATCIALTGAGFSDWYLPAICELGYFSTGIDSGCGTVGTPLIQNVRSNLGLAPGKGGFAEVVYWCSTEVDASDARYQDFVDGFQDFIFKANIDRVRCARAFSP